MIDAIQRAYYLRALNPSDVSTLVDLAAETGLEVIRFARDIASADIEQELQRNFALRRSLGVNSFPSLVLRIEQSSWPVPLDYHSHAASTAFIQEKL